MSTTPDPLRDADARVLARVLGELVYEGALAPAVLATGAYQLELSSGVTYAFEARRTLWGALDVVPGSVQRSPAFEDRPARCATFLIDARAELRLTDITAGHLLEEVTNTVFAEAEQRRRLGETSAAEMADLSGASLEALLDAHPKMIGNRGRLGFGHGDLSAYAPESAPRFRLRWIAARPERVRAVFAPGVEPAGLLRAGMNEDEAQTLLRTAEARGLDPASLVLLPVHPWQWDRHVRVQYASLIAAGDIVDLGVVGDRYAPQQSIRTLANVDRRDAHDVKLSLSILNTSCYRGIPARYIESGTAISAWAATIAARDPVLAGRGTVVLRDMAGIHCAHPDHARIDGAPYRYHEMLGAVWRESAAGKVQGGKMVVPSAALFQCDLQGRPLIAEYVRRSGLPLERWLWTLFDRVVVPLYHLLCRYGVGVVAHGQNIGLVLDAHRPAGMVLKDFHGDVRLVDQDFDEMATLPDGALRALARLPAGHLVHDLYTGHFVTVLRFVSSIVERAMGLSERKFYTLLARVLRDYQDCHGELAERFSAFDLFRPWMERICLNRARLRIGYGDAGERPTPDLGEPLANPLWNADLSEGEDE